ncbi:hypothetical protein [Nocardioides perillae]|uniref:Uncharacterized protein YukE n=1 Tax=Nocardioides perillae TaxID=1119534 RepID=A0A7Y9RUW4_9ACTN|nr:uncharacterized protein YukE [Nocardioides perillae]
MTGPFTLDVRPDAVRASAKRLDEAAQVCARHGRRLATAPERWRDGWRSGTARTVGAQVRSLAEHLETAATDLEAASTTLAGLAETYEVALTEDLPALHARWRRAQAAYDDAVADARRDRDRALDGSDLEGGARRMLQHDLDDGLRAATGAAGVALSRAQTAILADVEALRTRLARRTTEASDALAGAVRVPVPPALVQAHLTVRGNLLSSPLVDLLGPLGRLVDEAQERLDGPLDRLREELEDPPGDVAALDDLLARARELGVPPPQYAGALEAFWQRTAAEAAGIDLDAWDPARGADANRAAIEAVYRYYGDLYLADPDLQWAGMANMIGPSFAAGFLDLALFRRLAEQATDLPPPLDQGVPPELRDLADLPEDELRYFETSFLSMQKEIFLDQGTMHQAYVDGGLDAIRELAAARVVDRSMVRAWERLATGRPDLVEQANERFLRREQLDVIDDDYQRMRAHAPSGEAVTWLMTLIGTPSIPGARGYADRFPLRVPVETPGPERLGTPRRIFGQDVPSVSIDNPAQVRVEVTTPLPHGNIADFDDRWRLITRDTLPAYQALLRDDPQRARDLVAADVADRIGDYRLHRQVDDILAQLTEWDVDVDQ